MSAVGYGERRPRGVPAWEKTDEGWCVWGVPIDPGWWRKGVAAGGHSKTEMQHLAEHHAALHGGPGAMAGLVAGAIAEVAAWQKAGIVVPGRRWADIGGGRGYYALALKLAGATHATVLDERAPDPWAAPVLWDAEVEVIVGDATTVGVPGADAALLLYVETDPLAVLEANPDLRLLIVDHLDPHERQVIEASGWKVTSLTFPRGDLAMTEGQVVPGYEHPERLEELLVCQGEAPLVIPHSDDLGDGPEAGPPFLVPADDSNDDLPF